MVTLSDRETDRRAGSYPEGGGGLTWTWCTLTLLRKNKRNLCEQLQTKAGAQAGAGLWISNLAASRWEPVRVRSLNRSREGSSKLRTGLCHSVSLWNPNSRTRLNSLLRGKLRSREHY